jgi:hypothetical protein
VLKELLSRSAASALSATSSSPKASQIGSPYAMRIVIRPVKLGDHSRIEQEMIDLHVSQFYSLSHGNCWITS